MTKKTYRSLTGIQYTFPVKVNDKFSWISFSGDQLEYVTSNKQIQNAIESDTKFKEGLIGVASSESKSDEPKESVEPKEFPEVTVLNDAVAVLRGDPYRVHYSKLKSREAVMAIAKELGVSFPNLPNE